ncbi:MAG TPA: hypothetical protein ENJ53_01255 [Phaeodactylibacter sp.]|nr:hypothetical protein [Phaeodactylibacter sp.]
MDYVFASPLMDNGTVEKTETPIISYPKKNTSSIFVTAEDNAKYIDNKGFKISSDSSKILYLESNQYDIVPMTSPYDKFQLYVFDNNFQKIWEKEITFLYSDAKLKVEKFGVSNNGEVYILASRFMHTFHPRKVPEKYFLFYRVNKEGIISTTEIKLDNAYVTDVACSYHLDGSLFITGIYSSRNQKLLNTHGAFIMKYDVGNNLIFSKKHSFEETLLEKLKCTIQETTYRNYFKFSINYLLINHKKQTISFVAENRYSEPKGGGLFAVFFSDDILVPTFSFDGSLEWITHVDKKFKSPYIYHTPTVVSNRNGNIYLVSNAHKTKNQVSNFNHKRKQTMFSFYTDLIRVNTDGVVDFEKTIFHSRDLKKDLNTALSQRMHNGDFLLYFNTEKTFQYGTLTLPK